MAEQLFGRYLLVEKLAEGGMAQVYRAVLRETDGFEKQVALKRVLKELSADPDFVARFIDEARIVSTLSHSNIVQVFDFGQHAGEHFLAMELLDGPDLGSLLAACASQQQPLRPAEAIYIAAEMARGLGAAHRHSDSEGLPSPIVHRDVSPQNVLLSRSGEVKVVDFGIAKVASKALRTRTGVIMGKCRYMAPEQALNQPVDARSDVFSAGCVLFEMLAGRPLFDGQTTEEVFHQLLKGPIPPLSQAVAGAPTQLEQLVNRCLTRVRDQRYADGAVLARELETLLHRAAPEFSREDLAATIERRLPRRPALQQLQTAPGATTPDLVVSDTLPAPAPSSSWAELSQSIEPTTALRQSPPAAEAAVLVAEQLIAADSNPTDERGTSLALEETAPPQTRRLARGRLGLALLGAILAGVLLGLGAARLRPAPAAQPIALGQQLRHAGWRLQLQAVEGLSSAAGSRLLLRLLLQPPPEGALPAERYLLLQRGAERPVPPSFWLAQEKEGAARRVVFAARATHPASLIFAPPGAAPLRLALPAPGQR